MSPKVRSGNRKPLASTKSKLIPSAKANLGELDTFLPIWENLDVVSLLSELFKNKEDKSGHKWTPRSCLSLVYVK